MLVRPKEGILDPQGEAVRGALRQLGFAVDEARIGRVIDLAVEAATPGEARASVERMCQALLANPLIESFEVVTVEGDEGVEAGVEAGEPAVVPLAEDPDTDETVEGKSV